MARHRFQRRTAAIAALIVAVASCGLTACGSSSDPTSSQATTSPAAPRQAAVRRADLLELVSCARRHGVNLPPPTESGINVSGVKGSSAEKAVSDCYQEVLHKAARQAKAGQ